jgi:iron complex transport system ATP-binding protein
VLSFCHVDFAYDKPVLHDVSFALRTGMTCVLSPNAGGKSTLLKLAAGLLKPQSGQILPQYKSPKIRAQNVALLPQWNRVPELTVYELAAHGRYPHLSAGHVLRARDKEIIGAALEQTGAIAFLHRKLGEISGGQRQKAALAMALAQETPLLLLDEPTTYLDIKVQLELMELLQSLPNKKILMAIHDIPLALRFCDYAMVLRDGRLIFDGACADLPASGALESAFGVTNLERSSVHAF